MSPLETQLIKLGYDYEEVHPHIFLVRDFLSDESVEAVEKVISKATQEDWEKHYMSGVVELAYRKYQRVDIDKMVKEGLVQITKDWHDKNIGLKYEVSGPISNAIENIFAFDKGLAFSGVGTVQRQYSGSELREHVDNHADPLVEYAVIIYINDDYADGELFFSKLGFEIKPPKKSLIIFPSGEEFLHGVRPPGDGPLRYVLPSFVRRKQ